MKTAPSTVFLLLLLSAVLFYLCRNANNFHTGQ